MPYPKKKNLTLDMDHNVKAIPKEKSNYKPPKWTGSDTIDNYLYQRDMVYLNDMFHPEEDKVKIRERWKIELQAHNTKD